MEGREYDRERAAILSAAVGVARLRLREGNIESALATLDSAAAESHALHRQFLLDQGWTEEEVTQILG